MSRAPDPAFRSWVEAARATPIEDYAARRGWGLRRESATERSGPCPDCGGRDRFSVNVRLNVFRCRGCGNTGDPIALVRFVDRCDFLAACEALTGIAPPRGQGSTLDTAALAKLEAERAERRAAQEKRAEGFRERERRKAFGMWRKTVDPRGTPVEDYLRLRGLSLPARHSLGYLAEAHLYVSRPGNTVDLLHVGPAMVGEIVGPDGRFAGVHQTWLDLSQADGKAVIADPQTGEILPAKKVRGSQKGGRIGLARVPSPRRLVLGEGIETVLSVREALAHAGDDLGEVAFWSAINLGNLGGPATAQIDHPTAKHGNGRRVSLPGPEPAPGGIPIPDSVEELVLLGDGDSEPVLTRTALERAARRYARPGRIVRGPIAPAGLDFNSFRRGQ